VEQRLERWDSELRAEVRGGLAQVASQVFAASPGVKNLKPGKGVRFSPRAVIETALADVQERQSAWTAADLTRAISVALPDQLGGLSAVDTARLLDGLTAEALKLAVPLDAERPAVDQLPDELRRADGTSSYEAPGALLYATPRHLHTER